MMVVCAATSQGANSPSSAPPIRLAGWEAVAACESVPFRLGDEGTGFIIYGQSRSRYHVFFPEFLPALFERTLVLEEFPGECSLEWILTGPQGGATVSVTHDTVSLQQRFYDSFGLRGSETESRTRHPELLLAADTVAFEGTLHAVTVTMDYKLGLSVALNGRPAIKQKCLLDFYRHQLKLTGKAGGGTVIGSLQQLVPQTATVTIDPTQTHQTMIGFGGITTPTAYAQLSRAGKRRWFQYLAEYNLLIQREYPIGTKLNPEMDNFDNPGDASPHYYGENFPNGEISNFEYNKTIRRMGGQVWFEFWDLPRWIGRDVDKYADAVVAYCRAAQEKAGAPPDIVGLQNEVRQPVGLWHDMTLTLRRKLDAAGFADVKIHLTDAGTLNEGGARAEAFKKSRPVWDTIDFTASHMYDYQSCFTDPDAFDNVMQKWAQLTKDKPFISTELSINSDDYQIASYRIALQMAQLYHKNLTITNASAVCYCWLLINVTQPSYGWTRSLFVVDPASEISPKPSSNQLRAFGAYSRRIRRDMVRLEASADAADLLVTAFASADGKATVVALNRSTRPYSLQVNWPTVHFTEAELTDPYHPNSITPVARDAQQYAIAPGAIITLTNVALGTLDDGVQQFINHTQALDESRSK